MTRLAQREKIKLPWTAWLLGALIVSAVCIGGGLLFLNSFAGDPLPPANRKEKDDGPYAYAYAFEDGWDYIDKNGNRITDYGCDYTMTFRNGVGRVMEEGLYALVNAEGPLTEFDFSSAGIPSEERVRVSYGSVYGFTDYNGLLAVYPRYDGAGDFHQGLAAVCMNGNWGYIDKN